MRRSRRGDGCVGRHRRPRRPTRHPASLSADAGNHATNDADDDQHDPNERRNVAHVNAYFAVGPIGGGWCDSFDASVEAPIDERMSVSA